MRQHNSARCPQLISHRHPVHVISRQQRAASRSNISHRQRPDSCMPDRQLQQDLLGARAWDLDQAWCVSQPGWCTCFRSHSTSSTLSHLGADCRDRHHRQAHHRRCLLPGDGLHRRQAGRSNSPPSPPRPRARSVCPSPMFAFFSHCHPLLTARVAVFALAVFPVASAPLCSTSPLLLFQISRTLLSPLSNAAKTPPPCIPADTSSNPANDPPGTDSPRLPSVQAGGNTNIGCGECLADTFLNGG